ncbi:iron-siderophore ABC transporter substrate-binding protein [Aureimonas mangrovi]|uniref:ABC transporter substrate-binding protein n=1 Tax=Aureimonas mangrovi TaxID=2758041 RepID=UPI001AEF05F3|nr:iron-siderophore ABC transporter substrate-binding protein [Aureimonas mangrovi]
MSQDRPAPRVAALEWSSAEIAFLLGVPPLGLAERQGYEQWVGIGASELREAVDLGRRQQPSLEALLRLRPETILASTHRHSAIEGQLSAIAPTHLVPDQPADFDFFGAVLDATGFVGSVLGREREAEHLLGNFHLRLEQLRERAQAGGLAGLRVVLAQPLSGVARLRIFTANSAVIQALARIGLEPAMAGTTEPFGFTTMGLEDLAGLSPETRFLLMDEREPAELAASAVWPLLPVVAAGGVVPIGARLWPFGATGSLIEIAEAVLVSLSE